jgi:hypothetical protein
LATKLQIITELSERTTQKLTGTYENWMAFLSTAACNYKYSFAEQVLIYAQRPGAPGRGASRALRPLLT